MHCNIASTLSGSGKVCFYVSEYVAFSDLKNARNSKSCVGDSLADYYNTLYKENCFPNRGRRLTPICYQGKAT